MSMKSTALGRRVATCVAAMAAATSLAAVGPAVASADESIDAHCNAPVGITGTSTTHFTIPIEADAEATSTTPGVVPVSVSVRCDIKNVSTGAVYGTISQTGGPVVVAAGVLTVPIAPFQFCYSASALFSNGTRVTVPRTC